MFRPLSPGAPRSAVPRLLALLLPLLLSLSRPGAAQEPPPQPDGGGSIQPEAAPANPELAPAQPRQSAGDVASAGAHGFSFTSADGENSLAIHALVQAAYLTYLGQTPPGLSSRDTFLLDFAGLQIEATLAKIVGATLLVDFSQSRVTLINAFVEARLAPELTLRVGKFPTPINQERLTPKIMLPWISVSPASFLLPVDETGVQVFGSLAHGFLDYNLSVVNGSTAGPPTDNDGDTFKDLMGRLYLHPFKPLDWAPLADLGLGLGGSFGRHEGTVAQPQTPALLSYGSALFFHYRNDGTVAGTVRADGDVSRVVPHLTWSYGPLAAYADYVHEIDTFGATSVASDSWGFSAIVSISGEPAHPFQRIAVTRPFNLDRGQFGGLELILGGGQVHIDDAAFTAGLAAAGSANQMSVVGSGLHWYPLDGLGLIVDYSHTFYTSPPGSARPDEDALYAQLELRL